MPMETVVRDFALYLWAERGSSPNATKSCCYDLRRLFDFMAREGVESSAEKVTTEVGLWAERAGSGHEGAIDR